MNMFKETQSILAKTFPFWLIWSHQHHPQLQQAAVPAEEKKSIKNPRPINYPAPDSRPS